MSADIEAFEAALRGTEFEGCAVTAAPVPGGSTSFETRIPALHEEVEGSRLWRSARELTRVTGRVPVLVDDPGPNAYDRSFYDAPDEDEALPGAIVAASKTPAVRAEADRLFRSGLEVNWGDYAQDAELTFALEETARRVGSAPSVADVRASGARDYVAVQRFLLDWELERVGENGIRSDGDMIGWRLYDPYTYLLWLPTERPEEVSAYVNYYGGGETAKEQGEFMVWLRRWNGRYGLHAVGFQGVTLDLWVDRPPQDLETAFELATELHMFHRNNAPLRQQALDIVGQHRLQLFLRP